MVYALYSKGGNAVSFPAGRHDRGAAHGLLACAEPVAGGLTHDFTYWAGSGELVWPRLPGNVLRSKDRRENWAV